MINNVVHSHKTSDVMSSKTSTMRQIGNFVEEKPLSYAVSHNGGAKTVSHNSNNISLGSNHNFTVINEPISTLRPSSVRENNNGHQSSRQQQQQQLSTVSSNSSHSQQFNNQMNTSSLSNNNGHSSLIASQRGQVLKDLTNNNETNNRLLARDPSVQHLSSQLN